MKRNDYPSSAGLLLLAVVALVGLNLRPFLTGVGPLAASVSVDTGLDLQGMALLTLVPMLLMGGCSFAGPALQDAVGARRLIIAAIAVLSIGSFLRLFVSSGWALIGTAALLGFGAAIVQAVFPSVIKLHFPRHVMVVTGLYSSMLMGGGALGAQISPFIAGATDSWRLGLAWAALPALIALVLAVRFLPNDNARQPGHNLTAVLLKRPRTWLLMACFGLMNGGYASIVAWLAPSYLEHGWSGAASGSLLAVMAISQALSALLLPALASKGVDRRPWLLLTLLMQAAGFVGLALWPEAAPVLWVGLVGAGLGGCFALLMVVALDHLPDPAHAGALSALMQGGGFLLAAIPPWIVAVMHDVTGGFRAGWLLHVSNIAVVACLMLRLAPRSYGRTLRAPPPEHSDELVIAKLTASSLQ